MSRRKETCSVRKDRSLTDIRRFVWEPERPWRQNLSPPGPSRECTVSLPMSSSLNVTHLFFPDLCISLLTLEEGEVATAVTLFPVSDFDRIAGESLAGPNAPPCDSPPLPSRLAKNVSTFLQRVSESELRMPCLFLLTRLTKYREGRLNLKSFGSPLDISLHSHLCLFFGVDCGDSVADAAADAAFRGDACFLFLAWGSDFGNWRERLGVACLWGDATCTSLAVDADATFIMARF